MALRASFNREAYDVAACGCTQTSTRGRLFCFMAVTLTDDLRELKAQAEGAKPFKPSALYDRLAALPWAKIKKMDAPMRLALGFYTAAQRRAEGLKDSGYFVRARLQGAAIGGGRALGRAGGVSRGYEKLMKAATTPKAHTRKEPAVTAHARTVPRKS